MRDNEYIKLSLAQATWAHQAGREVFQLVNQEVKKIEKYSDIYKAPELCFKLNDKYREVESEFQSNYSTKVIFFSMGSFICSFLSLIQMASGLDAWMYSSGFALFFLLNIIKNYRNFHSQKKNRYDAYLVGTFH